MDDKAVDLVPDQKTALDVVAEMGIPDPVQKSFLKSADRLLGSLTDIPAAWLEGFADDRRATTEARRALRIEAAKELAKGFGSNSDLANRVYAQHVSKILGEQINLEDIVGAAAQDLAQNASDSNPPTEPSDDWLNAFRTEASQKSSADMKAAFAKVLSGEVQTPGSFSLRAVKTLGMIDTQTANLFRNFCNVTFFAARVGEARAISVRGNAANNSLQEFGLSFHVLNVLHENGLIISDYDSWTNYAGLAGLPFSYSYGGKSVELCALEGMSDQVRVNGVALSQVGRELFPVVDVDENKNYTAALDGFLQSKRIQLKFL